MITRKSVVRAVLWLPALLGLIGAADDSDDSKISQSAVHYQKKPNGKQQCSNCVAFLPSATPDADGKCRLVAGVISPHGFCGAYSPKDQ